jgi:hypothetical protein
MTEPFRPDDELVSAVLDGEATEAERARVAGDPVLAARLAEFAAAAERVAEPVAVRSEDDRDRAIAAAVAERHRRDQVVVALHRNRRRDAARFMASAAAALVVLLGVGVLLSQVGSDDSGDSASGGDSASDLAVDESSDGDDDAAAGGADAEAAYDQAAAPLDLGPVADESALRQTLERYEALEAGDFNTDSGEANAPATTRSSDSQLLADSEECQLDLEEADPGLDGVLVRALATYAGEDAVVLVYGTDDGRRRVVVVSGDGCRTLADFPL